MDKGEILLTAFVVWLISIAVCSWIFELIGQYGMKIKVKILRLMLWATLWSIILFSASFLVFMVSMPQNSFGAMENHIVFFLDIFAYALGAGILSGNLISLLKQQKEQEQKLF
ncbi:MAG: hypothetical protein ACJ77K_17240 [Bacteroidia bacterium]